MCGCGLAVGGRLTLGAADDAEESHSAPHLPRGADRVGTGADRGGLARPRWHAALRMMRMRMRMMIVGDGLGVVGAPRAGGECPAEDGDEEEAA